MTLLTKSKRENWDRRNEMNVYNVRAACDYLKENGVNVALTTFQQWTYHHAAGPKTVKIRGNHYFKKEELDEFIKEIKTATDTDSSGNKNPFINKLKLKNKVKKKNDEIMLNTAQTVDFFRSAGYAVTTGMLGNWRNTSTKSINKIPYQKIDIPGKRFKIFYKKSDLERWIKNVAPDELLMGKKPTHFHFKKDKPLKKNEKPHKDLPEKEIGIHHHNNKPVVQKDDDMMRMIQKDNDMMRKISGEVNSDSALVCFFYILMRDYLNAGAVEDIISQRMGRSKAHTYEFTNGWLANYAEDIVNRLSDDG